MARKARAWTAVDTEAVRHILRLRDADVRHLSLRAIGTATGISHGRIGDLFNFANGAPSLNEFVSLCLLFNRRPSQVMEEVMRTVESADGSELAALSSSNVPDDNPVGERSPESDEGVVEDYLSSEPTSERINNRDLNAARNLLLQSNADIDIDSWANQIKAEDSMKTNN